MVSTGVPAGVTGATVLRPAGGGEASGDWASAAGSFTLISSAAPAAWRPSGFSLHVVGIVGGSPVLPSAAGVLTGVSMVSISNASAFLRNSLAEVPVTAGTLMPPVVAAWVLAIGAASTAETIVIMIASTFTPSVVGTVTATRMACKVLLTHDMPCTWTVLQVFDIR